MTEHLKARAALAEAAACIRDLGAGKGGWAWEEVANACDAAQVGEPAGEQAANVDRLVGAATGWPPGLLQDDCRGLSAWLAARPDALRRVREACIEIEAQERKVGT